MPLLGGLPADIVAEILRHLQARHGTRAALALAATSRAHRGVYLRLHGALSLPGTAAGARGVLRWPLPALRALRSLTLSGAALSGPLAPAWASAWGPLSGVRRLRLGAGALRSPGAARALRVVLLGCRSLDSLRLTPVGGALRWALAPCAPRRLEIAGGDFAQHPAPAAACVAALAPRLASLRVELAAVHADAAIVAVAARAAACPALEEVEIAGSAGRMGAPGRWAERCRVTVEEECAADAVRALEVLRPAGVDAVVVRRGPAGELEGLLRKAWWDIERVVVRQRVELDDQPPPKPPLGTAAVDAAAKSEQGVPGGVYDALTGFWRAVEESVGGGAPGRDAAFGRRAVRSVVRSVGAGLPIDTASASMIGAENSVQLCMRREAVPIAGAAG